MKLLVVVLLACASLAAFGSNASFAKGQRVYVVGLGSRRGIDLEIQRKATDQFKKQKVFIPTNTVASADFVFIVVADEDSDSADEVALALSPEDYKLHGAQLDEMRTVAIWQSTNHLRGGKEAGKGALAGATLGASLIFARPTSVSKELVKKFHKDVAAR